jgi:hypothetical protein
LILKIRLKPLPLLLPQQSLTNLPLFPVQSKVLITSQQSMGLEENGTRKKMRKDL